MTAHSGEQEASVHREAIVNGVRLHYVEAGNGPLVVLLHGFPAFWYSWHEQIRALAAAGFRVIAPDMRGYNISEKPHGVRAYRQEALAGDVAALIHHAGEARASVVGHDWGGGVAWSAAMFHPDIVERLIVLNAPHPGAFLRDLRLPSQLRKSWYGFFFQIPWLPETVIRAGGYAFFDRALRGDAKNPKAFTPDDVRRFVEAAHQPGALTGSINYYRAAFRQWPWQATRQIRRIDAPTLLIWGEQDRYLGLSLTEGLENWVPDLRVARIPEASHWVQNDAPDDVNRLMIDFLREAPGHEGAIP